MPLTVVKGPQGAVLALVPVFIHGQGPFAFALDTGASQSLIDARVVEKLGLKPTGKTREATGVSGSAELDLIKINAWRVGDIELPPATVTTLFLPEPNPRHGLQGLLGSDMLSRFDAFTLDYRKQSLTLRDPPR